jgi:hypothetical protein
MQRNAAQIKDINENSQKFVIPVHEEVTFKDNAKYLDVQMQDSIKKQLEGIDEEVEKLGKVCDNMYKKSYEEYKSILDKEREELDNNVKKYISNLKDNLIGLRNRINYDYKGKYKNINTKLNKLVEELKVTTQNSVKLDYKRNNLKEDCSFYEKEIDNMKDMNLYLKYKLKLFLGDFDEDEEEENNNKKVYNNEIQNKENNISGNNNDLNNNNININNRYNESDIRANDNNKNITEKTNDIVNKKATNNEEENNKEEDNNEEDKLYITATKNLYNSNKKKGGKEFDEISYLNSKLDLEELQLLNYIHHEKEKNAKLSDIYNTLFVKTNNQYFTFLKDLIDEQKNNKSIEKSYLNESNNNSIAPSVYNSSITISNSESYDVRKNFYTPENPGPGYITRKGNKEIILTFLENLDVKKIIYKLLYGENE